MSIKTSSLILRKIKEERGQFFNDDIDIYLVRKNLGCTLIATYGTETTKSAIQTACRGYRSEEYPDGIDVDTAQVYVFFSASERGFLWPLKDVVNGNKDKERNQLMLSLNEINQYPGLLDIMVAIEGLVNKRSSHACYYLMKTLWICENSKENITQYDLHM